MWLIASLPFWFLGGMILVMAISALIHAYSKAGLAEPQHEWNRGVTGVMGFIALAGVVFYIAAKIAS